MLLELARSLRALTRSPIESALHSARHMARPFHFEDGGTVPTEGRVVDQNDDGDFLLPFDVDPMVVALAIDEKLRNGRKAGASETIRCGCWSGDPVGVVVAGHHLLRLG